jgi:negative regulator of flagellin synthesis FlgM
MKILTDVTAIKNDSLLNAQNASDEAKERSVSKTEAISDNVQLSSRAKDFQRIKDLVSTAPESREEKVAEIKEQLNNGTYKADIDKAAESMINESLIDLFA